MGFSLSETQFITKDLSKALIFLMRKTATRTSKTYKKTRHAAGQGGKNQKQQKKYQKRDKSQILSMRLKPTRYACSSIDDNYFRASNQYQIYSRLIPENALFMSMYVDYPRVLLVHGDLLTCNTVTM